MINHRPRPRCCDVGPLNITTKRRRQSVSFFTFNKVQTTFLPPLLRSYLSSPSALLVEGHLCPLSSVNWCSLTAALPFFPRQKTYTDEELNAKLTRRVQKAARRQAKQEELKRLHRAQVGPSTPECLPQIKGHNLH